MYIHYIMQVVNYVYSAGSEPSSQSDCEVFLFLLIMDISLLLNVVAALPIPPVVDMTRGKSSMFHLACSLLIMSPFLLFI